MSPSAAARSATPHHPYNGKRRGRVRRKAITSVNTVAHVRAIPIRVTLSSYLFAWTFDNLTIASLWPEGDDPVRLGTRYKLESPS
jgi:hypothetical protein